MGHGRETISILIPSYRRSEDLGRCLESLKNQTRLPEEVIVVIRDSDLETQELLKGFSASPLNLLQVIVCIPGQVGALNAGLEAAHGTILAITDDDSVPKPDWLARIEAHFQADTQVGGVGGRDWVYFDGVLVEGAEPIVGKIQWFGRVIGNHHLGIGNAREVDVFKGANMSFRRAAVGDLRFDPRLRGSGAQVHNDLAFSLEVKKRGWKLIYDPLVAINHYPASRFDEDARGVFHTLAQVNSTHNETFILLENLSSSQRIVFFLWAFLIGTARYPGLLQVFRLLLLRHHAIWPRFLSTQQGRYEGWKTYLRSKHNHAN